ncbi:FHA domain-containing protein [Paludisphaera soli]|uniref:FHA domain-containing protein n=1 Tax=Paludisphaera soli TaxID=2712865 RepID=UPI0013EDC879
MLAGRDPRCDLVLDDPRVSRSHAYFQVLDGRLFVLDLGSRTGLIWPGGRGRVDRGWLAADEPLEVGDAEIRRVVVDEAPIEASSGGSPAPPTDPDESSGLPTVALEWPIKTPGGDEPWRLPARATLIGRSEGCHLALSDDSVSRLHAVLLRTPLGTWAVDLGSREGVIVGGEPVRWAWLEDGDVVRIGRFSFIVRCPDGGGGLSRRDVPLAAGASVDAPGGGSRGRSGRTGGRDLALRPKATPGPLLPSRPAVGAPSILGGVSALAWPPPSEAGPMPPAIWQQQMQLMESFHNDMILMVQMFVAMHKEHLATVRVELDRVEQLTRELSTLQEQLAGDDRADRRAADESESRGLAAGEADLPRNGAPPPSAESRSPKAPPRSGGTPGREGAEPRPDAPRESSRTGEGEGPAGFADPMVAHGLLTERIASLQRERQGYWRRIIGQFSK